MIITIFAFFTCYMYIINQLIQLPIILVLESGLAHIYVRHACYARTISLRGREAYNPLSLFWKIYIQISNYMSNICYLKISIFHPFTMHWLFLQETELLLLSSSSLVAWFCNSYANAHQLNDQRKHSLTHTKQCRL